MLAACPKALQSLNKALCMQEMRLEDSNLLAGLGYGNDLTAGFPGLGNGAAMMGNGALLNQMGIMGQTAAYTQGELNMALGCSCSLQNKPMQDSHYVESVPSSCSWDVNVMHAGEHCPNLAGFKLLALSRDACPFHDLQDSGWLHGFNRAIITSCQANVIICASLSHCFPSGHGH